MFARAIQNFAPRPRWRMLSWARRFAHFEDGKSFEAEAQPYLGAPGGPFDAIDDPDVRQIYLQFGIRMGKTVTGQFMMLFYADVAPYNMLFASSSKILAEQVIERTTKMAEHHPRLAKQLPPEQDRNKHQLNFANCKIHAGWFRSDTTLADKDILVGHGNEVDKIVQVSTATEGDPLERFLDRATNKPRHKYIIESTPQRRNHSRVEAGRLASTNCSYYVPCPHCKRYQTLQLGNGKEPGGVRWDRKKDDTHDENLARRTARYQCVHCEKDILDHHRGPMIRAGVWAPEGCSINDAEAAKAAKAWCQSLKGTDGAAVDDHIPWRGWSQAKWIKGKPQRDGTKAGYHLSRLYDLTITWGDIAAKWVSVQGNKQKLRSFLNEWMAETWSDVEVRHRWEALGRRLALGYSRGTVPADAWFLTAGVDVQEDRCYWIVRAWGAWATSWLVDWGVCHKIIDTHGMSRLNSDLDQLDAVLIKREFPVNGMTHEGHAKLWAARIAIDTGHRIADVHQFMLARPGDRIRAVKGDANVKSGYFRAAALEKNTRTGKAYEGGLMQYQLNVDAYKEDIRDRFSIAVGDPGAFYFPKEVNTEGADYLRQICNEAPVIHTRANGVQVRVWQMIQSSIGNHHWDDEVYARAAADFVTEGDWEPHAPTPPEQSPRLEDGPPRRRLVRRTLTRRR